MNKNGTVITDLGDENPLFSSMDQSGLHFSPNPFSEDLYLRANEQFDYAMYDLQGVMVENGHGQNVYYAGSSLATGLYVVKTKSESGDRIFKVVKK